MSVDKSKVLLGYDIEINDMITLRQPTVDEIIEFGEEKFFSVFYSLCSIPSDYKSVLWDAGLDFMKVSDWELFLNMCKSLNKSHTSIILGDLDFSQMDLVRNPDTGEAWLENDKGILDENLYVQIIPYLREMVGYVLKREKAGNKFTKMVLIDEDRRKRKKRENDKYESMLFSIIISLVNTEEFPYNYKTVREMTLYQLIKSFEQIQNKKAACALYQGSMSGFVDTSKISNDKFQWTYNK